MKKCSGNMKLLIFRKIKYSSKFMFFLFQYYCESPTDGVSGLILSGKRIFAVNYRIVYFFLGHKISLLFFDFFFTYNALRSSTGLPLHLTSASCSLPDKKGTCPGPLRSGWKSQWSSRHSGRDSAEKRKEKCPIILVGIFSWKEKYMLRIISSSIIGFCV